MSKKKKEEPNYSAAEIYENLNDEYHTNAEINQYIKAKEAGFDIFDKDVKLSSDDLRQFRMFLVKNLKPEFTHSQLRELKIGFLEKLDISQFADKNYSPEEMRAYRKALKLNFPINKIKLCRDKEPDPKHSVQAIISALRLGYNFNVIKDIPTPLLTLMCTKKSKDKIDIFPLIKRGFEEDKIHTILSVNERGPLKEKIEDYITPTFSNAQINTLGNLHMLYKYDDIKNLINDKISADVLVTIYNCTLANRYLISPKIFAYIDETYDKYKTNILLSALTKKQIEFIANTKCSHNRYKILSRFSLFTGENFNEKYFSDKYNDTNVENAFRLICYKNVDDKILDIVENLNFDKAQIDAFYNGINKCLRYTFDVVKYLDNKMSVSQIDSIFNAIITLSKHNQEITNSDLAFISKNIKSANEVKLIDLFCDNINYKKINYTLNANNFTQNTSKAFAIISKTTNKKEAFELMSNVEPKLFCTIGKFIENGHDPKNLMLLRNDSNMAANMIVALDDFNKNNKRKIDVEEIINLNATIREKGVLISKLISSNLEDNIQGYEMLNELSKNKTSINKDIDKTR